MNTKQRFKLGAGAGLVTMLLGALMVLAPGAGAVIWDGSEGQPPLTNGGNLECSALDSSYTLSGKENTSEGQTSGSIVDGGFKVDWSLALNDESSDDRDVRAADNEIHIEVLEGSLAVWAVIIKTGNATNPNSNGLTAYEEYEFPLGVGDTDVIAFPADAISNIQVCGKTALPETGTVTVVKQVTGDGVPESWSFDFTNGEDTETLSGSDVERTDSFITPELNAGTNFTVSEDSEQDIEGYDFDGYECVRDGDESDQRVVDSSVDLNDLAATVVVEANQNITCTFTNDFPGEPAEPTLRVEKEVVGNSAGATFAIDVNLLGETDTLVADGVAISDTPTGAWEREGAGQFSIEEVEDGGADSTTWECFEGESTEPFMDSDGESDLIDEVTVSDADVTCVFTNTFAPQTFNPPQTIQVVKQNVGPAALDDWEIDFEIDGPTDRSFTLSGVDGEDSDASTTYTLPEGTYVVSEELPDLGDLVTSELQSLTCEEGGEVFSGFDQVGDTASVVLGDGDNVVCTFVNAYTEVAGEEVERGSLEVVKRVEGPVPGGDWSFDFTGTGPIGTFDLTDEDAADTFTLDPGEYTVTEVSAGNATLTSIDCGDADVDVSLGSGSVTVDLDEGEDARCVFTNTFPTPPSVAPAVVTPTTQPAAVLGVQTVRSLPRTGDETRGLAGVGAFMLALGAAMVIGSRRQLARR